MRFILQHWFPNLKRCTICLAIEFNFFIPPKKNNKVDLVSTDSSQLFSQLIILIEFDSEHVPVTLIRL